MSGLTRLESARQLPPEWDQLAACLFQRRDFLAHAERHNPCAQRYWLLERDGRLVAGAVVYTLRLDLLTFLGLPSPVRMQVVGLPCSVSTSGLLGAAGERRELAGLLLQRERGLLLALNLDGGETPAGAVAARTLPTVVLERRFADWDEYLASLRAGYRRRLLRLARSFAEVTAECGSCRRYDTEAHALYLQVLRRSKARLETLSEDFFAHLPEPFRLTTYREHGELVGWHICVHDGGCHYFFLGGLDYKRGARLNTYFNLLTGVLRQAIAAGSDSVDFGQTAEVPKLRLGGALCEKGLFAYHRSPLLRGALRAARGLLEYRGRPSQSHVLHDEASTSAGGAA